MSIATKTGDTGTTGLLYGSRVSKTDKRIAAVGDIDELNAVIGLTKASLRKIVMSAHYTRLLESIQRTLTYFMGEIVAESDKRKDYANKFSCVTKENLQSLDIEITSLEKDPNTKQTDWVMYGATETGALFDLASKVCRRAERSFLATIEESDEAAYRPTLFQYINRLSDLLYLLARYYDNFLQKTKTNPIYSHE